MEKDGKLYEIFPMYMIRTHAAKTADVGDKSSWTLEEFADFVYSRPDADYIIDDSTKAQFILTMVEDLFIDSRTGECRFERDEFVKILEIAERFPATSSEDMIGILRLARPAAIL
jgi:hypothetical protein